MAERRMISKSLLGDNRLLQLNNDAKILYIYLLGNADDDGIVQRSLMIDGPLGVDDKDYRALEESGLLIPDDNNQIEIITDWNNLQSIRKDIYKPTQYLEVRSQLFIKTNYSYTKNPNDKNVFISADDWVRKGRPKYIVDFKPWIQQYLDDRYGYRNGVRNFRREERSIDENRIEKISTDEEEKREIKPISPASSFNKREIEDFMCEHNIKLTITQQEAFNRLASKVGDFRLVIHAVKEAMDHNSARNIKFPLNYCCKILDRYIQEGVTYESLTGSENRKIKEHKPRCMTRSEKAEKSSPEELKKLKHRLAKRDKHGSW